MTDDAENVGRAKIFGHGSTETIGGHTAAELEQAREYLEKGGGDDPEISDAARELDAMLGHESGGEDGETDGSHRDPRTGRFVPHQAMHAERVRRKEAEDRARELESKVTKAEERLATINDLMEKASRGDSAYHEQPPVDPGIDIDPERDIFGAVRQLRERNAALVRQQEQRQAADQYRADILSFKAKNPYFLDAHQHLTASREAELEAMGIADSGQRKALLQQEERGLILSALQQGKSPSAIMYQLAKGRGYRGSSGVAPMFQPSSSPSVRQVQNLQSNMSANATLSGAGGSPGEGLTVDRLVNMSDDDFAEVVQKMGGLKSHKIRALGADHDEAPSDPKADQEDFALSRCHLPSRRGAGSASAGQVGTSKASCHVRRGRTCPRIRAGGPPDSIQASFRLLPECREIACPSE